VIVADTVIVVDGLSVNDKVVVVVKVEVCCANVVVTYTELVDRVVVVTADGVEVTTGVLVVYLTPRRGIVRTLEVVLMGEVG
jgi:hypothetical protein